MQINKETFEAWLFSQPDDKVWNYEDNCGCVVACFIKETTNINPSVVPRKFRDQGKPAWFPEYINFPQWLINFEDSWFQHGVDERTRLESFITAKKAKALWIDMFGSPVVSPEPEPEHEPAMA